MKVSSFLSVKKYLLQRGSFQLFRYTDELWLEDGMRHTIQRYSGIGYR